MKTENNNSDFLPKPEQKKFSFDPALFDYALGFAIGVICSLFGFYTLVFFKKRKHKRAGMVWGCFLSFIIIFAFCLSFAFYTSYVQGIKRKMRSMSSRERRLLRIKSFSDFIKNGIKKIFHLGTKKSSNSVVRKNQHLKKKKVNSKSKSKAKAKHKGKKKISKRSKKNSKRKSKKGRKHHLLV